MTTGNKKLLVAGLIFSNEPKSDFTMQQLANLANSISDFYERNSRGLLKMATEHYQVHVPVVGSNHAVTNIASKQIKNQYPDRDYYIIVSSYVNGDHSGLKCGYVKSCLYQSGIHECGHLIGLNHSNTWVLTNGKWNLETYQDGLSAMSKFSSPCLAGPQYLFEKWIPDEEIITVSSDTTITLKRINNYTDKVHSIAIVNQPYSNKTLYITAPQANNFFGTKMYIALHLGYNECAGSEKIQTFANKYNDTEFSGLNFEVISSDNNTITLSIKK